MRAVVLRSGKVTFYADYPRPQRAAGEVLVRVLKAGICETDLQLMQGYMGFEGVLGHEFVGVAEEGRLQGKRVVGEINCNCGKCTVCAAGLGRHCPNRTVLGILNHDGAFADYVAVPEHNLHAVPDGLSDEAAVFTEPSAAALEIAAQVPLISGRRVVVLGDGRLGNLCAQVIASCGCALRVVGKHREKLELLRRRGIETSLLGEVAGDRTADVVVDCTGSPTGLTTALEFVRPRGTIVLKTTVAGEQTLALAPIVIDEITIVGSRCGDFLPALAALQKGRIDPVPLITAVYPLERAVEAFERAKSGATLKVLLEMG
jgi:threonine dehydrogenase-like Zn-dependent dehydrogenase